MTDLMNASQPTRPLALVKHIEKTLPRTTAKARTVAAQLTGRAWLPQPEHGLDALWPGLAELRAEVEQARAVLDEHDEALERATATVEAIKREREDAPLDADLPSARGALEALEDAKLVADKARQEFAKVAVGAFATLLEREQEWRAASDAAVAPFEEELARIEQRRREIREGLRAVEVVGRWFGAARGELGSGFFKPFGLAIESNVLTEAHWEQVAETNERHGFGA